jgi:hypothetical protein
MSEHTGNSNDENVIDMSNCPDLPPRPLPEKVRALFLAERARWAKLARESPEFRSELKRHYIYLTPEELGESEPPTSGAV